MISKIARINNGFLKYTAYRLYEMETRLIIICTCGVLGFPLIMLATVLNQNRNIYTNNHNLEVFLMVSTLFTALSAGIIGIIVYTGGTNNYDYYNRREKVDLSWSLPVTVKDRFWGDFAAGLVPVTVVYILSALIGLFIAAVGFNGTASFRNPEHIVPTLAAGMFIGLLALIALYIVGVFCAAICGRVFESISYPALICILIPSLVALFGFMIFSGVWQIDVSQQINTVIAGTSPGGFLICSLIELGRFGWFDENAKFTDFLFFLKLEIMLPFILIHGGFLAGAYYAAKNRKAESTGKAFTVKYASEILLFLAVFCITAIYALGMKENNNMTSGLVFGLVATTAVAFLFLDVSAKRGFKKMSKAFLRYSVMVTVSVGVSSLLLISNGFGSGEYVPPMNRIQSAEIRVIHLDDVTIGRWGVWESNIYRSWHNGVDENITSFTSEEALEIIRQTNIDSNKNSFWNFADYQQVVYTLNNGRKITRNIRVAPTYMEDMLPLVVNAEYKQSRIDFIDNWLAGRTQDRNTFLEEKAFVTTLSGERVVYGNNVDVYAVYEAFKKDFLAETFEQKFLSEERVLGRLTIEFNEMVRRPDGEIHSSSERRQALVFVKAYHTNLIKELERQGLDVWNGTSNAYFSRSEFSVIPVDYISVNWGSSSGNWWGNRVVSTRTARTSHLIDRLLEVAQPSYLVNGRGVVMMISDSNSNIYLVIPPEYNDLVEEFRRAGEADARDAWSSSGDAWSRAGFSGDFDDYNWDRFYDNNWDDNYKLLEEAARASVAASPRM
jgi:hypothetical protein